MKTFSILCLTTLLFACYPYGPPRQGYTRPSVGGWYLPAHPIGDHHLQLTLLSRQSDSTGDSTTYGAIECFLTDTLPTSFPLRNVEVTSLRIVAEPGDTIDAALTHYAATLDKRENNTFVGPRTDISPFRLPDSTGNIVTILSVRLPAGSADGRDSMITFTEQLQKQDSGPLSQWVTWEAYPNPFCACTRIDYAIPGEDSAFATLELFNVTGKRVAVLVNGYQTPGRHEITPNFDGYPSGIYFYRLTVGTFTTTKKIVLLK